MLFVCFALAKTGMGLCSTRIIFYCVLNLTYAVVNH